MVDTKAKRRNWTLCGWQWDEGLIKAVNGWTKKFRWTWNCIREADFLHETYFVIFLTLNEIFVNFFFCTWGKEARWWNCKSSEEWCRLDVPSQLLYKWLMPRRLLRDNLSLYLSTQPYPEPFLVILVAKGVEKKFLFALLSVATGS